MLKKTTLEKWPILDQNYGKMSVVRLFELFVFRGYKGVFFDVEYRKRHFPCLYFIKKQVGKRAIFGPKPWVNPFGKMSIFFF